MQTHHQDQHYYADHDLWKYGHWLDSKMGEMKRKITITSNSLGPLSLTSLSIEGGFEIEINSNLIANNAMVNFNVPQITISNCDLTFKEFIANTIGYAIKGKVALNVEKLAITAGILSGKAEVSALDNHYSQGKKTQVREHLETVLYTIIKAREVILNAVMLELEAIDIESAKLYIAAKNINFPCVVTTDTKDVSFHGKEDWWLTGASQSSNTHTKIQAAHPVEIIGSEIYIKSEGLFEAVGMKLKTTLLHMESSSHHFTGMHLDNAHSHSAKSKGGIFSKGTKTHSASNSSTIEGVLVMVGDVAYIIAHDTIWLEAASIAARNLNIEAEKLRLAALVGHHFHGLTVQKAHARLALTAGGGEFSVGAEMVLKQHAEKHYKEHVAPSVVTGEEVHMKVGIIEQVSSEISGQKGKLDVKEWHMDTVPLYESHSLQDIRIKARGNRNQIKCK